jgi:mono/diheme cytochrome c family protein
MAGHGPGSMCGSTLRRGLAGLAGLLAFLPVLPGVGPGVAPARAEGEITNPRLGQPEAIAEGEVIYRSRCVGCHGAGGSRGPKLFQSKLSPEQFLNTVINGRKGTNMPPFGYLLSPDEVWRVHTFVMSRDHL